MTDAKMVFSIVDNAETVFKACSINNASIPKIVLKTHVQQSLPEGAVDFFDLMDLKSKDIVFL